MEKPLYMSTLPALLGFCAVLRVASLTIEQTLSTDDLLALVPDPADPRRLTVHRAEDDTVNPEAIGTVTLHAPVDPALLPTAEREARFAASDVQEALDGLQAPA